MNKKRKFSEYFRIETKIPVFLSIKMKIQG